MPGRSVSIIIIKYIGFKIKVKTDEPNDRFSIGWKKFKEGQKRFRSRNDGGVLIEPLFGLNIEHLAG